MQHAPTTPPPNPPIDPALRDSSYTSTAPSILPRSVSLLGTASSFQRHPRPYTQSISDWGGSFASEDSEQLRERIEQLAATVDEQDCKVAFLEHKIQRQDALLKRLLEDAGWEADGEEDEYPHRPPAKKKTKAPSDKILSRGGTSKLTEAERKVKRVLQTLVNDKIKELAGTPTDEKKPPTDLPPGEHKLPDGRTILIPDFGRHVNDRHNEHLVLQTARIVFNEQMNEGTCDLQDRTIPFTLRDVEEFAKGAFHSWKAAYIKETVPTKKEKAARYQKKLTCTQRRRQKKMDWAEMNEEYLIKYGADPTPLLMTDWMSDYVSELEDGAEEDRRLHRIRVAAQAGYSALSAVEDVTIWERVHLAFRSDELVKVYKDLDELCENNMRQLGKKKNATHKRVDLLRVSNRVPSVAPYPFMVDEAWRRDFAEKSDANVPLMIRKEDPPGFGSRKAALADEEL